MRSERDSLDDSPPVSVRVAEINHPFPIETRLFNSSLRFCSVRPGLINAIILGCSASAGRRVSSVGTAFQIGSVFETVSIRSSPMYSRRAMYAWSRSCSASRIRSSILNCSSFNLQYVALVAIPSGILSSSQMQ